MGQNRNPYSIVPREFRPIDNKNYGLALLFSLCGLVTSHLTKDSFRRRTAFVQDTNRFRKAIRDFLNNCALNVTCCEWSSPILIVNGAKPSGAVVGKEILVCKWQNCRLVPGLYSVKLEIKNFRASLDKIYEAISFEIRPTDIYGTGKLDTSTGLIVPDGKWEIK